MSSPEVVAMAAMSVTPPANDAEHARLQSHLRAVLRLKAGCDNPNSVTALTVRAYASIVDEVVADVAGELHRAIATGLDTIDSVSQRVPPADDVIAGYAAAVAAQEAEAERLRAGGFFGEALARDPSDARSKPASASAGAAKDVAGGDLYGRGPGAAKETAECPLCAQTVAASRFAHHLERCLGKGRLAVRRPAPSAAPAKAPAPPRKPSAVGRPPNPIENTQTTARPNTHASHHVASSAPVAPVASAAPGARVRFVLNPRSAGGDTQAAATAPTPARSPPPTTKTRKTKSVAALMGLGAMDDVPLSAIAFAKPRAKKETRESKAGTRGKEKGSREAEKKTASEKVGKSAGGVAAGKVAKKETAAERRAAVGGKKGKKAVAAAAKKRKQKTDAENATNVFLSVGRVTNEGGVDHVSVDEPFGGGGAGNAFGTRLGLGGFGAPAGDSFAFEHERGAGDGSGSTHEDFELLFDVDDSGGATGKAEGVLTGGFRDLFAS